MAYIPGDGPPTGAEGPPYVGDPVPAPQHSTNSYDYHSGAGSAPAVGPNAPAPDYTHSQPAGMLTIGSRGPAVADLQRKLGITADGIFGPATQQAVINYQRAHGLTPDGVAGPATLGKLGLNTNPHSGNGPVGSSSSGSSGSHSTSAASAGGGGGDPTVTPAERAAEYGWSLAVINSNPELAKIFAQASAPASKGGNWSAARFVAAVRDTTWFKTHADSWRQAYILQKADPATWNNNLNQAVTDLNVMATQMGASLTAAQLRQMATDKLMFGWDNAQIQAHLATAIRADSHGNYLGQAGAAQAKYNQLIADYGATVSSATMGDWVKKTVTGAVDSDIVKNYLIQQAASKYPALAERIKAGETVRQIADPYLQSYAKVLEVNPETVSMNDRLIQQAFTAADSNGKPAVQTLWQFEQNLRNDPRWSKTQNAHDAASAVGHGVLQSFGLVT